ncbi:MAG: phospholipase D-like domain-containing protein [Oligoflexia bacterium]|nr:phospholipase D-like domain-containing protein [Oligoflexia bacterium]
MKSFTLAKNLSPAPAWARETVLPGGDRYFVRLLEAFSQATSSIDLETYIFENGPLGNAVLGALETAAARGVRVRLIVDGLGSPSFNRSAVIALAERGIDVRVYHPLPWVWFSFSGFLSLFFKLNRRDHRKLCVIDGRIAFTGSMNVSADHLKEHRGTAAWRDTGVEVEGPDAGNLVRAFERTWMRATGVHHRLGRWSPSPWRRFRNQSALVRLNT